MEAPKGLGEIASYHAHIYFDASERERAAGLRELISERFTARVGSWHEKPIGPHTKAMYQVAFAVEEFPRFVPWLMLNRDGLSVLVHPNTLWPKDDHLVHALWLGPALPINDSMLPVQVPSREQVEELPPANTTPTVQP
jgi:aromatic ring-cleaving dioxygenase